MADGPPRFPQWLLERFGSRGSYLLGDLNEEYHTFAVHEMGRHRARIWYWKQFLTSVPPMFLRRAGRQMSARGRRSPRPPRVAELGQALRSLRRYPGFTLTVVVTLGVGVGAGASIFSLVDMLLLRPPPGITQPEHVRQLAVHTTNRGRSITARSLAWIDYEAVRGATNSIEETAAWFATRRSLGRGEGARNISLQIVTPSFFTLLGARPALGRFLRDDENVEGINPVPCVVGHRLWTREFEGTRDMLGRRLTIGELECVVVGVAARGFNGLSIQDVDLWLPIRAASAESQGRDPSLWTTDGSHWLRIIGRLRQDVSDEVANQEATAAYRGFSPRVRDPELSGSAAWESIIPGRTVLGRQVNITKLLFAASLLLLLLIAFNLVNLFSVRELSRERETAIRLALGSPVTQLFLARITEVTILSIGAGALGIIVASWFGPLVRTTLLNTTSLAEGPVTLRVASVAVGLALITGVAIAAIASLRLRRVDPAVLLASSGSARSGGGRGRNTVRMTLVGVQTALSVTLLVGSFAFVMSFRRATGVDLGFDRRDVIVARASLSYDRYSVEEQRQVYDGLWRQARDLPGVTAASLGYMTPWWNNRWEPISIPGRDTLPEEPTFRVPIFDMVTADYLSTLRLTLLSGRWISENDLAGSAPVVVINEALRDLYWPGQDPLGQCMRIGRSPATPCRDVVGVVQNHAFTGSLTADPVAAYFLPYHQSAEYGIVPRLFVRTQRDSPVALSEVVRLMQTARPNLPAPDIFDLQSRFEPLIAPWRVGSYAFTALGILATCVGTFGLFSILSYVVTTRRHEFSVRAAMGGSLSQIALPVVRQGLATIGVGAVAGCLVTLLLRGIMQPLLFDTNLTSPVTLGGAVIACLAVALVATVIPARSAARGNPLDALRNAD